MSEGQAGHDLALAAGQVLNAPASLLWRLPQDARLRLGGVRRGRCSTRAAGCELLRRGRRRRPGGHPSHRPAGPGRPATRNGLRAIHPAGRARRARGGAIRGFRRQGERAARVRPGGPQRRAGDVRPDRRRGSMDARIDRRPRVRRVSTARSRGRDQDHQATGLVTRAELGPDPRHRQGLGRPGAGRHARRELVAAQSGTDGRVQRAERRSGRAGAQGIRRLQRRRSTHRSRDEGVGAVRPWAAPHRLCAVPRRCRPAR